MHMHMHMHTHTRMRMHTHMHMDTQAPTIFAPHTRPSTLAPTT